jgi:hypothetical protein
LRRWREEIFLSAKDAQPSSFLECGIGLLQEGEDEEEEDVPEDSQDSSPQEVDHIFSRAASLERPESPWEGFNPPKSPPATNALGPQEDPNPWPGKKTGLRESKAKTPKKHRSLNQLNGVKLLADLIGYPDPNPSRLPNPRMSLWLSARRQVW